MSKSFPMNGGDDKYSYAKNSTLQEGFVDAAKDIIKKALEENLDIESILSDSTTFRIADLGCSVGPNTFWTMQTLIESVHNKYRDSQVLEFQVFFNDQTANDFNTLFNNLPSERRYFVCGVPGSFHDRVFPSSSIHLVFTSYSLHYLSKIPIEVQDRNSPTWNKGRIHYACATDAVVKAYSNQFEEDMENFLRARAREVVQGGMVVIIMIGAPDGVVSHTGSIMFTFVGSILMDMVKEGKLEEDLVDSFNIPQYYPSTNEMRKNVEKNGCFSIMKIDASEILTTTEEIDRVIMHFRALLEGTIANHFGSRAVSDIFDRAMERKADFAHMLHSPGVNKAVQLFVALKRN